MTLMLQPHLAGRREGVLRLGLGSRIARIHQQRKDGRRRHQFMQQLQPLSRSAGGQIGYAGHVAAWLVQTGDKPNLDWIGLDRKDSRNCRRCAFRRQRSRKPNGGYQRHPAIDQIRGKGWQSTVIALRRVVDDRHRLVSDIAFDLEALIEDREFDGGCRRQYPKNRSPASAAASARAANGAANAAQPNKRMISRRRNGLLRRARVGTAALFGRFI